MEKLVVLLPIASNLNISLLQEILDTVRSEVKSYPLSLQFLLTVNEDSPSVKGPQTLVTELSLAYADITVYTIPAASMAITDAGAARYVRGFDIGSQMGDYVIDIDSAGAHDPLVIGEYLEALLGGKKAVFSTRFGMKGAKDLYPFQRQIASRATTFLGNLLLGVPVHYPDLASGYQGFRSDVLRTVFGIVPPEDWITMKTTTAFIETELRSYVVWLLHSTKNDLRESIRIQPIIYGLKKKGVNFPAKVGLKALEAFLLLSRRKSSYIKKCRTHYRST